MDSAAIIYYRFSAVWNFRRVDGLPNTLLLTNVIITGEFDVYKCSRVSMRRRNVVFPPTHTAVPVLHIHKNYYYLYDWSVNLPPGLFGIY